MKKMHNWKQFNESLEVNEKLSDLQIEYRSFFKELLSCYDVKSPQKLSDAKKKEFFKNVKKYWVKGKGLTKDIKEIKKEVCGIDENIVDYNQQMSVVKGEVAKIKKGVEGGMIDLGVVGQVSDIFIKNIKKTYPYATVSVVDDRYVMKLEK
jgi:tRNA nucleotidyltransferase/poly(A) polymerase